MTRELANPTQLKAISSLLWTRAIEVARAKVKRR